MILGIAFVAQKYIIAPKMPSIWERKKDFGAKKHLRGKKLVDIKNFSIFAGGKGGKPTSPKKRGRCRTTGRADASFIMQKRGGVPDVEAEDAPLFRAPFSHKSEKNVQRVECPIDLLFIFAGQSALALVSTYIINR